jgi:hypothetical protein
LLPSHEIPQIFLNVEIILGIHSDLLQKVPRYLSLFPCVTSISLALLQTSHGSLLSHQLMKRLGVEKISPARSTGYLSDPNSFLYSPQ